MQNSSIIVKNVLYLRFNCHRIYLGIYKFYSEDFGSETRDSIFWRKNINTAYHIDYCIASDNLMQKMVKFEFYKIHGSITQADTIVVNEACLTHLSSRR